MSSENGAESTRLHQLLTSKIHEIMNLDPCAPIIKDGVLQSHLLQKTRHVLIPMFQHYLTQ